MSTLTRQNRIPDYKDYMNFVSGYRNGKKDENPPKMTQTCESYSSFLEKSKNRKFEPVVAPPLASAPKTAPPKKLVKTELYLEINQDESVDVRKVMGDFEIRQKPETHGVGGVMSKKKLFENKSTENHTMTLSKPKTYSNKKIIVQHREKPAPFKINDYEKNNTKTIVQYEENPAPVEIINTKIIVQHEEKPAPVKINDEFHNCNKNINKLSEILQEKITKEQNINKLVINTQNEDKLDAAEVKIEKTENSIQNIPAPPPMPNFQENPTRRTVEQHKRVETIDSIKCSTVNNTERIVKKMAYSAMLDMYGAYHDKANSYVATLPKNRVRKENGLQKIIDNIAAQGGLEKLSGRSNPKQDD